GEVRPASGPGRRSGALSFAPRRLLVARGRRAGLSASIARDADTRPDDRMGGTALFGEVAELDRVLWRRRGSRSTRDANERTSCDNNDDEYNRSLHRTRVTRHTTKRFAWPRRWSSILAFSFSDTA